MKSAPQTQKALLELRQRIFNGHLPAGKKLREVRLAEDVGISRTPLREALLQLEQEGFLVRGRSGYTVRTFSLREAIDAIELRGILEATVARLAAERGVSADAMRLIKSSVSDIDHSLAAGHYECFAKLNLDFHNHLSQLADSGVLVDAIARASCLPFASPSAFPVCDDDTQRFRETLKIGQQHHRDIVVAIENGESSRAEWLVREHDHLARRNVQIAYQQHAETNIPIPQLALVEKY